jgi:hypothetical protein
MFCPNCATKNIEGAHFCRSCGANLSLVPQALTGQLPVAEPDRYSRRRAKRRNEEDVPASLEKGIVNIFMGIGFLVAALAVMFKFPGGFTWGWAFFIPAFSCFGRGVAMVVAARKNQQQFQANGLNPNSLSPGATPFLGEAQSHPTNELVPPVPSVTEGTTRHLGVERTRQK